MCRVLQRKWLCSRFRTSDIQCLQSYRGIRSCLQYIVSVIVYLRVICPCWWVLTVKLSVYGRNVIVFRGTMWVSRTKYLKIMMSQSKPSSKGDKSVICKDGILLFCAVFVARYRCPVICYATFMLIKPHELDT